MSLDIAPPPAISASGGPPGAGPPTVADHGQAFATLLAQQGSLPPSRPTAKSPSTADETRDEIARKTKPDKDADEDDEPASTDLSLISQATPPDTAIPIVILVLPGPPIPPAPSAAAAGMNSTFEAMDTRPASMPASQGGPGLISGGELLSQSAQSQSPTAEYAPASTLSNALPQPDSQGQRSGQGSTLIGAASAGLLGQVAVPTEQARSVAPEGVSQIPLPATITDLAAPSTKTALQGYAQFVQNTLQNPAKPANNTGIRGDAPAIQGQGVLEQSVSTADNSQTQLPLIPVPTPAAETLRESTRQDKSQDDTEKDKSEVSGSEVFNELLTPTNSQLMETKTATVSTTASLPTEGRAALLEQAAASMQTMHAQAAKSGHGQMTLQLHPQDWGKLQVSVTMAPSPGGTVVSAHLVADSAAVKHVLESSSADLKRTLRDAGLHLDNFTVTVRPAASGSEAQNMGGHGRQNASPNTLWDSTPSNRGDGAANAAAGNGGTTFGGNGANSQSQTSRQRSTETPLITATTNEPDEQPARAATSTARRLDTRA